MGTIEEGKVQETTTGTNGDGDAAKADDPMKNLKAEFNRKIGNVENQTKQQIDALTQANSDLQNLLRQQAVANAPAKEPEDDELWITDPGKAKAQFREQLLTEMRAEQAAATQAASAQQNKYQEMAVDFPELYQAQSELVVKANEIFNKVPEKDRTNPHVVEATILKAATQLGIKPKGQRSEADKEFVGSSSGKPNKPDTQEEAPSNMMEFARLLGRPVDDPEYKKRLSKTRERKDWLSYK